MNGGAFVFESKALGCISQCFQLVKGNFFERDNNMIKLVAVDLDGTLFGRDHKSVSQRNVNALKKLSENNVKVVIASGRTYSQITNVIKRVGVADYIVCSNGASVIDVKGNVIATDYMEYEKWKKIYDILFENKIATEVYVDGKTYMDRCFDNSYYNKALKGDFIEELKSLINFCDNVTEALKDRGIEKLSAVYVPAEKQEALENRFKEMNMAVTSSIPFNMEINKWGVSKEKGLKMLCEKLGIMREEVMAFGDGNNDIEMLKWAGLSFAMGNADEKVKKSAKYVTETNENDGVAVEIEKLIFK